MAQIDFAHVYLNNKEKIWNLLAKYVPARQDREDLFQEVFLRIHKALPRFRGEAAVETWVYRIAVNTAINYVKKQQRFRKMREVLRGFRILEDRVDEPADDSVWRPMEKLNPLQRMILLLSDVEEFKIEEISTMLKVPIGTVKSNLHRAREMVRKELKENG